MIFFNLVGMQMVYNMPIENYISTQLFLKMTWGDWILLSIFSNVFLYLFSIALYLLIDKTCQKENLQTSSYPLLKNDVLLSFITVACNCIVMLIGVAFWKEGWIVLRDGDSIFSIILQIIGITLTMDLLMYVFHYAAHLPTFYSLLHQKHHQHVQTNYLSLFVLHPLETIGFGIMMIALFMVYNFSLLAISIYLIINLIWGTIGHSNKEFFPKWMTRFGIGTTRFHHDHHLNETKNFGFYTSIWDRLFKTYL